MSGAAYQQSTSASKGNAFCWLSWHARAQRVESDSGLKTRSSNTAESMRKTLASRGAMTATDLGNAFGRTAAEVRIFLKHDVNAGRIRVRDDTYELAGALA
jgi:hypothetical protein